MDLSCIISSGDLELYVLGMLPEEESSKIEQLAQLFPEVQEEIDLITESLAAVAAAVPATPSPAVKDNLMSKLKLLKAEEEEKQNKNSETDPSNILYAEPEAGKGTPAPVIPISTGAPVRQTKYSAWLAASVIGLVISLSMLIYLSMVNNRNESQIAVLQQQMDTLNKSMTNEQQRNLAYSQTLNMMQSEDYRKVDLVSVPGKPAAKAQVLWNKKTSEVYLADVSLPKAPAGKQYQLWGIVDGQPVDAGCISGDTKQLAQKMKTFPRAQMFAITLENEGCSPTPTLDQMYVAGKPS